MNHESLSLRPATLDDLSTVEVIEQASHLLPWNQDHFKMELEKPYSHFLVLTDDDTDSKIFGYIVYWLMFDECQILNVVVDLPYRGQGHGKRLMRQAVSAASRKGIKKVTLDVRKSNLSAIQLYQGLGFVITQIRKSFYSNGEDAYQMLIELDGDKVIEF